MKRVKWCLLPSSNGMEDFNSQDRVRSMLNEAVHDKTSKMYRLSRVLTVHMKKREVLSQSLSAQQRP